MDYKRYHLFFEKDGSVKNLSFKLEDTPLTELWIKNLEEADRKDIVDVQCYFSEDFVNVDNQLESLVNIISEEFPDILKYWKKPLTQDQMNDLHQYFHSSVEGVAVSKEETQKALGELNLAIHKWEMSTRSDVACVFYRLYSDIRQPLPLELRKYWSIDIRPPGTLTLGYYTIGKELWSCYLDNDMEVVKSGMVRPQLDVHTQVVFDLNPLYPAYLKRSWVAFDNWCNENNTLAYGVHSAMPIHRTAFKPVLAIAEYLPQRDHIRNMWNSASKITWTLE